MTSYPDIQYFLGANAPGGFYSLYSQLMDPASAHRIYILKGGPGCGKSTLMRRVAAMAREVGQPTELILCSGDPDSLDAVILPDQKTAIVDGTSPHVVEPKYPGLVEQYVNMGRCYDSRGLQAVREGILSSMTGYKDCYQSAYRCLRAAAEITEDARAILHTPQLEEKLAKRAQGILSREVPRRRDTPPGQVKQRFLGAVTHKGVLCLYSTALAQCSRVYEVADHTSLSHLLLTHLLTGAVEQGFDTVACPDPMAPDRLAHLLIPELGLAFLSSGGTRAIPGKAYRRIRLSASMDKDLLRRSRGRLRFAEKVSSALVEEAVVSLTQAKAMHDELEALYNPYVDFQQVEQMALAIGEEIFGA